MARGQVSERTLDSCAIGECVIVTSVGGSGALRQHFLDMGVIPGVAVTFEKYAPMGDPMEFRVRGYQLTLRVADAAQIGIRPLAAGEEDACGPSRPSGQACHLRQIGHPGLGEFNTQSHEDARTSDHSNPVPQGQTLTFALAGNQNCVMSCTTKLTIYGFLANAFFPGQAGLVMIGLYLLGILLAVITGLVVHATADRGEAVPFVMELPTYRLPSIKSVGRLVWDKSKDFLTRASSVVFLATVAIWFLQGFTPSLALATDPSQSILACVAGVIAPVFAPLGFGDWRIAISLICGFMAKETVVSTISVLFGSTAELATLITPAAALALLVFCLLYTPCVAAVASIKRELGWKWALWIVVFQCVLAWVVALAARFVGMALGLG